MMSNRHYRPIAVPLMTQVVALPGQWACRGGAVVSVDGNRVAIAKSHDRMGRPLPSWQGCHRVRTDELFLLNPAPDSLDGRYFGALPADRKSVGSGKSVSVRVGLGGRRIIKKKRSKTDTMHTKHTKEKIEKEKDT